MPTTRETVFAALHARLQLLAALTLRDEVLPERIPAAGLIILRDGQPVRIEAIVAALNAAQALWLEYYQLQFEDKPQHEPFWEALGRALNSDAD